jgi:DNA-binding transcriptional LysR family regulator
MPLIDHLEKLRTFESVCRLKSFSLAASELQISQPAISKAISVLEKELLTQLLTRSRKGVTATVQGQRLLLAARDIFKTALAFDDQAKLSRTVLKIGTKEPIAAHVLADFFAGDFESTLELVVEPTNSGLISKLVNGKLLFTTI